MSKQFGEERGAPIDIESLDKWGVALWKKKGGDPIWNLNSTSGVLGSAGEASRRIAPVPDNWVSWLSQFFLTPSVCWGIFRHFGYEESAFDSLPPLNLPLLMAPLLCVFGRQSVEDADNPLTFGTADGVLSM